MKRSILVPLVVIVGFAFGVGLACTPSEDEEHFRFDYTPGTGYSVPAPDSAYCSIVVEGVGTIDMETDYLPHVITCENGGANLEALKAQAIAARSVAYYYMANSGSVCDSQGCQVYTCSAEPSAKAYQAVEETSGLYVNYNDVLTYAFYVAGDPNTAAPSCVGTPGVGTEGWVTYNEGKTGDDVEQTALGWVFDVGDVGYGQNRGCMSQWGARCLENDNSYDYEDILRFYYGADINITQAPGECIMDLGGDDDTSSDDGSETTTDSGETSTDEGGTTTGTSDDGPDPDIDGDSEGGLCNVGSLGCECTMGGGCDPGLICTDGYCVPEATGESGESGEDDAADVADEAGADAGSDDDGGFRDDAFGSGEGCDCASVEPARGFGGSVGALLLIGLFGWRRRR
ncbi:hypothetical protein G6O69_21905 [Pseudenhygromyxa sp. WMMC2535]|uniref:SpoIID/LytB domain-containing protein n=1 Tax=Pseudenhygromyxa sp. WMMC2535 TaxID=2712867 RepID=UPI0015523891|nr:SpoIID/LytB domain-containing protein [Pseudenhygromyxa sp. WMMC2535]NVB40511.1 hypothetical protein [Pseudenhygromyxa sp. WMMC2535]